MKPIFFITIVICLFHNAQSQSVGIGTTTPSASALLEVNSKTKGILIPKLTKAQKIAIPSPATGLMIFQISPDSVGFHFYDGNHWEWIQAASNLDTLKWGTAGNTGTNAGLHFIGTRDNMPLVFKVNSTFSGKIDPSGSLSIGRGALAYNPGNKVNTAFGDWALNNNSLGSSSNFNAIDNTAIGEYTLFTNVTGSRNTAVGKQALFKNVDDDDNTAMGYKAMENATSDFSTAVGSMAASKLTTGDYTTAIGYNAASNTTTGAGITAVGYVAGNANATGTANTAIGFFSNVGAPALTNATAIGAYATVNTSNSLVLGNNAKVGIGTSSPLATLHVKKMASADSGILFQGTQNASVFFTDNLTENVLIQAGKDGSDVILNPTLGGKIRIGGLTQNNVTEVAGKMFANELGGVLSGGFNMVPLGIVQYEAHEDDDYLGLNTAYGSFTNLVGMLGVGFNAFGGSNLTIADDLGCVITLSSSIMTGYSNYFVTGTVDFNGSGSSGNAYTVSSSITLRPPSVLNPNNYQVVVRWEVDDFPNIGTATVRGTFMVYGIR
jgi:hypothetical protein